LLKQFNVRQNEKCKWPWNVIKTIKEEMK